MTKPTPPIKSMNLWDLRMQKRKMIIEKRTIDKKINNVIGTKVYEAEGGQN